MILKAHVAALDAMHLREPSSHETLGTLLGPNLVGEFHEWQLGDKQRRDERLGFRVQRVLRVGNHLWLQNSNGEIRELTGLVARRQVTQDFIDSGQFAAHPEVVHFVERATLPDGRVVYRLRIDPKRGEPYVVGIDAKTWLIDEESFLEHDSAETLTYDDYHVIDGMLIPYTEIDSNGDHKFDITSHVKSVIVNQPIAPSIFAALAPLTVDASAPTTTTFEDHFGLIFTYVTIGGKKFRFLIDSASQGNVIDPHTAAALGLHPEGSLEVTGAARTASLGVVELPDMILDGVTLPTHVATVLDLSTILGGGVEIDGVLGYPFLAAAEVQLDPGKHTMIIAKPGTLPPDGAKIDVDTDRELPEIVASVDQENARFVVDTGNTNELLLFKSFIDAHAGLISYVGHSLVPNRGIGGSTAAVGANVEDLQIGPYHMYNRFTNVILASAGAFADKNDGGNIGYATLRNFVITFDLANHAIYLQRGHNFDDGRYRNVGP